MLFTYSEGVIPTEYFNLLYNEVKDKVRRTTKTGRSSCLFCLHELNLLESQYNSEINVYNSNSVPKVLEDIRTMVELHVKEVYDYCLVHIYETGEAGISPHFDSEAMNSSIASVSLGATRKFRLKEKGKQKGWDHEFHMKSGDLIVMHKGCQAKYLHCVPPEMTVKTPRINITFRQYEL